MDLIKRNKINGNVGHVKTASLVPMKEKEELKDVICNSALKPKVAFSVDFSHSVTCRLSVSLYSKKMHRSFLNRFHVQMDLNKFLSLQVLKCDM